jgi:regulator of protease activity HflC (stomatin/prohibitin superfamily)
MAPLDSRSRTINRSTSPSTMEAPAQTRALGRATLLYLTALALAAIAGGLLPYALTATSSFLHSDPLRGAPLGAILGSLLIALGATVPCIMLVIQRSAAIRQSLPPTNTPTPSRIRRRFDKAGRVDKVIGRIGSASPMAQGLVTFGLAVLAGYTAWHFGQGHAEEPARRAAAGGTLIVAAFPLLIIERFFARIPPSALPEAADLAGLLYVPVIVVLACGALEAAAGLGIAATAVTWLETYVVMYVTLVAAERAIRAIPAVFAPTAAANPPPMGSVMARLLRPGSLSAAAVTTSVKQRFGLDFSRSWAIRFVRAAAVPVLLCSLLFCWFLSAVVSVGLDQRGQYERFGVPGRILQSGLHLVLPWPFGTVRRVEHGVIHSVTIGDAETTASAAPGEFVPTAATALVKAEDIPPASANRLWDQPRQSEASYVIASTSANHQSFETISADLRVLFRVGLDDEQVRRAAYRTSDPATLVRTLARERLAEFFATRTLADVLGADREAIANELRQQLSARLDALRTGIEVVAVIVEAAQPPSGAADAYHHVQAAQIDATTQISMERGRATAAASVATRQAHDLLNQATGSAAETIGAAKIDLTYFKADDGAYHAGGHAFILERYFANLKSALARTVLEVLDDRLDGHDLPTLDLRPLRGMDDVPQRNSRQ